MPAPGRKGKDWRRARELVLKGATRCAMPSCLYPGVPLNPHDRRASRRHPSGWRPGPTYPTVDHLVPVSVSEGWSKSERDLALHDPRWLRPAHMACNSSRGRRPTRRFKRDRPTRDWGV